MARRSAWPLHRIPARFVLAVFGIALLAAGPGSAAAKPPNIVLMLGDNVGFGELGVYGGGVLRGAPTPRLDRLAAEGVRFTNFNTEVECSPSRSALMTGRLPVRSGTWRATVPGMQGGLAPWERSIAEVLSEAGYNTAIFGKWHLGDSPGRFPTDQGFDEWWGFPFSTNVAGYTSRVGFDPKAAPIPQLLEGKKGEAVHAVEPYTLDNRPLIDERIAGRSVAYIREHAGGERPFFLFIAWSLAHHPYLPNPAFKDKSGNGAFSDCMVEHDYRVGQVLDAIDAAGIADNTLVVYASDNGPDSAHYPQVSFAGPFRGYLGSAYEGSIRTPMLIRWPGKVPAGRTSNEMVAILDFFPTLAAIAGAKVPDDRAIDGVDQRALFLGESDKSGREAVIIFSGKTLLAVKWRRFKIFLTGDDPAPRNRSWRRLWAPLVYNVEQDPREDYDTSMDNLWVLAPMMRQLYPLLFSVEKEGIILPGAAKPTHVALEIPFQSQEEIEQSMAAIKRQVIEKKVKDLLPFGGDGQ